MQDLDIVVCFEHRETGMCIDMKYIKSHLKRTLRIVQGFDFPRAYEKEYLIDRIPFSDDWEMKLNYLKPEDYNRLMIGDIDKELNDKVVKIIDTRR